MFGVNNEVVSMGRAIAANFQHKKSFKRLSKPISLNGKETMRGRHYSLGLAARSYRLMPTTVGPGLQPNNHNRINRPETPHRLVFPQLQPI